MIVLIIALVLAVLIIVHELGHLIAAKLSGVGVECFSLGFGPPILKWRWRATTYLISVIPLGGYVKLEGEDFEPGGFYSRPFWAKVWVTLAGPLSNFLLGAVLFALVFLAYGQGVMPARIRVEPGSPLYTQGLRNGDLVVAVDGEPIRDYESLVQRLKGSEDSVRVEFERSGERMGLWLCALDSLEISPSLKPVIEQVKRGGPADRAGLSPGDRVLEIAGVKVSDWQSFVEQVQTAPGETLAISWQRNDSVFSGQIAPDSVRVEPDRVVGQIGVTVGLPRQQFGPGPALLKAFEESGYLVAQTFVALYQILVGKLPREALGGPILMAQLSLESARWGLDKFLSLLALLSLNLFVINILPIPVLDGGRFFLFLIEELRRRRFGPKGWKVALQIGWAMVLGLIIFATFNDLMRLLMR